MAFEGKFWMLWEEQPLDMEHGQFVALRERLVLDGRTGEMRGAYSETADGVDIVFEEDEGERYIARLRMAKGGEMIDGELVQVDRPFDPSADSYSVTWSTVRYENYLAARPPLREDEPDEVRWDREHAEETLFGLVPTHGAALRDGPHIREMHEQNRCAA